MSMKTIAKFLVFVIFLTGLGILTAGCSTVISNEPRGSGPGGRAPFLKAVVVGNIQSNDVVESSGIAASKCQPGVYWTHNDSGDGPNIYAFNEKGQNLGTFRVSNAQNDDWEDIAEYRDPSGTCFIYIGDI